MDKLKIPSGTKLKIPANNKLKLGPRYYDLVVDDTPIIYYRMNEPVWEDDMANEMALI